MTPNRLFILIAALAALLAGMQMSAAMRMKRRFGVMVKLYSTA